MGNEALRTSRSAGAAIFRRQSTRRRSAAGAGGAGALGSGGGASVDDELAVTPAGLNDNFDTTPKPARRMDKIRRSLSFRRKKKSHNNNKELQVVGGNKKNDQSTTIGSDPASSTSNTNNNSTTANGATSSSNLAPNRPPLWIEDERKVRAGNCSFQVKYLGYQEVSDSRGMPICELAIEKMLGTKDGGKNKPIKAILHVSGDSLRVVDESNKTLLVDQTIEKVSFCAPDRHHEEAFAYICRDGTTRRWLCHGFVAVKDTLKGCGPGCSGGERLSHAVGCAFSVCLEKKQKREKINSSADTASIASSTVTMEIGPNHSFTRLGSFRQASLSERFEDPQIVMPSVEPVPIKAVENPHAIERPKSKLSGEAGPFQRQNSLRMVNPAPFQRAATTYQSLRPGELPSFQQQKGFLNNAAQQLTPTSTTKATLLTHSTSNPISLSSSTTTTPSIVKSETLNRITEETIAEEPSVSQVSPHDNSKSTTTTILSNQLNKQLVIRTTTPPNLPPPPSSKSPAQQQQSKPTTPSQSFVDSSTLNTTPQATLPSNATTQNEWASFDPILNPSSSTLFNTPQSLQSPQPPPILPPLPASGTTVLTTPTIMNPYYQQAANNIINMTPNMFVTPTSHMNSALASPPLSATSETFEQKWDRIQAAKKTNPFAEDIAKKYEIKL